MNSFLYRLDGRTPIKCESVLEWAEAMEDMASRSVAFTDLEGGEISTVFIGINIHGDDPPVVFETAILAPDDVEIPARYSTWDEALAGHEEIVLQYLKKG